MNKRHFKYILQFVLIALVFSSCAEMPIEEPIGAGNKIVAVEFVTVLDASGLPLSLVLEDSTYKVNARWNATFGRMELSDASGTHIFIAEDTISCEDKKTDLESGILEIEYSIANDSLLSYISKLPQGQEGYPGFFVNRTINGRSYTFENNPIVEYSDQEIKHMIELVMSIRGSKTELNSQLTQK